MPIWKFIFATTILTIGMYTTGTAMCEAKAKALSRHGDCPRVPTLELQEALRSANEHLSSRGLVSDLFTDHVELKCIDGEYYWEIGWRRRNYESGHLLTVVSMDGKVEDSIVKDG